MRITVIPGTLECTFLHQIYKSMCKKLKKQIHVLLSIRLSTQKEQVPLCPKRFAQFIKP